MTSSFEEIALDPSLLWEELAREGERIVLCVIDGLGGLADTRSGRSELEAARTPNLDALAAASACGLIDPVAPGVTPGSGPGHLGLFGYHPLRYRIGRGVLSALGIDFALEEGDVAARVNFASLDGEGRVSDRRAGRIDSEHCRTLCERIRDQLEPIDSEDDVEWFLEPVREHRAVLVLRGADLSADLEDTDPHREGVPPQVPRARSEEAGRSEAWLRDFVGQCERILGEADSRADTILLRGFERHRALPSVESRFGLRGLCLAEYPMYRGLSRLLGLEVEPRSEGAKALFTEDLVRRWPEGHDFVFLHYKATDSRGEDGDFEGKVAALEELDGLLGPLREIDPAVLVVTGDHSTPARLSGHSWHPVPILIHAETARRDRVERFDELSCANGSLGLRPAIDVMGLALAHAGRLRKFGA